MATGGRVLNDAAVYVRLLWIPAGQHGKGKKGPLKVRKAARSSGVPLSQPVWDDTEDGDEIWLLVSQLPEKILLKMKQEDSAAEIGRVEIPFDEICNGMVTKRWFRLDGTKTGQLQVTALFLDARTEAESFVTIEAPSPERFGCRMTLYQDAHCPRHSIPNVLLDGALYDKNNCLWEDVYRDIMDAQHFIYITDWSFCPHTRIVRNAHGIEGFISLGDLLKDKAEQGITVLILIWDEVLSVSNPVVNMMVTPTKTGVANTHDETTFKFFENTKVKCQKVLRHGIGVNLDARGSAGDVSTITALFGSSAPEIFFSHHQKTISLDAPSRDQRDHRRCVVSYCGGLDLTAGRYDTPEHTAFTKLDTLHTHDFYQTYGRYNEQLGPRQPWHDVHARLEGQVALDVVKNFEQRWKKQCHHLRHHLVDLCPRCSSQRSVLSQGIGAARCSVPSTATARRTLCQASGGRRRTRAFTSATSTRFVFTPPVPPLRPEVYQF